MKKLFSWAIKNGWNIFSCIGVFGTFYFSLVYVPGYVKEINTAKINITHESLINDVQELLFYDKKLSIGDINSLIKGKELEQSSHYPFTSDELLLQVQDRFVTNKFIPLEKRESLIEKIKTIRSSYVPPKKTDDGWVNKTSLISFISSMLGLIATVVGALSILRKNRIDKETEIDIVPTDMIPGSRVTSTTQLEFEEAVGEVLNDIGEVISTHIDGHDRRYDFEVSVKNKSYIVEVKNYRRLLGLSTAQDFIHEVNRTGKRGVLIVSSGFTERARGIINEHNKVNEDKQIHLVAADNKSKLREQLQEILVG